MSKTTAELEAENAALRRLLGAIAEYLAVPSELYIASGAGYDGRQLQRDLAGVAAVQCETGETASPFMLGILADIMRDQAARRTARLQAAIDGGKI